MEADINEAKSEIDKALNELNTTNTSIGDMLERVTRMADKEINQEVSDGYIPYRVYNLGAIPSCDQNDEPFIATI